VPSDIIKPKEMQSILWDVMRAQALSTEIARKDSSINEVAETKVLNQKVFELHRISAPRFDKSYSWYTNHPDALKSIFDSLNNQNQRENELRMKEKYQPKKLDSLKKFRKKYEQSF
jgi:Domain of unknown function (DUF4296)